VLEDAVVVFFDDAHGVEQVEGVDGYIADIGNVQRVEWRGARGHVVRADHHRFAANLPWSEPGTGAQRSAYIQRNADKSSVELVQFCRGLHMGQAKHGGDTAKARHFIAAQGLVERMVHVGLTVVVVVVDSFC
jgi:hypothetical protein